MLQAYEYCATKRMHDCQIAAKMGHGFAAEVVHEWDDGRRSSCAMIVNIPTVELGHGHLLVPWPAMPLGTEAVTGNDDGVGAMEETIQGG